jgi:mannose-1-phosphate guanylyltransferase
MKADCYSVIMAGGKGTRFWPLSRAQRPKQLLKIFGAKSLIAATADRVLALSGAAHTLVVTIADQLEATRKELQGVPKKNFLAEPWGKNTAPCIGLAALEVVRRSPDAVMVVLPADHWVADTKAFRRTLDNAIGLAVQHDQLITIGIRPAYPETGYGYIMKARSLGGKTGGYRVQKFIEKPNLARAQRLIRQGSLWNSGIFVWRAATLLRLMGSYMPALYQGLQRIMRAAEGESLANANPRLRNIIAAEYHKLPSVAVDVGIMEPASVDERVLTVDADFGWSDVGSWAAVHRMLPQDKASNSGIGRWLAFDAKNCLIHAPDRLVALLGIDHAVVVDTPDALLVGDIRRSQEVRELVDHLQKNGYGAYTIK